MHETKHKHTHAPPTPITNPQTTSGTVYQHARLIDDRSGIQGLARLLRKPRVVGAPSPTEEAPA